MRLPLIILLFIGFSNPAFAENRLHSAVNPVTAACPEIESIDGLISGNPGSHISGTLVGFFITPSPFGMPELLTAGTAIGMGLSEDASLIFSFSCLAGNSRSIYREISLSNSFAYRFTESFSAGLALNFLGKYPKNYDPIYEYNIDFGCLMQITNDLEAGLTLTDFAATADNAWRTAALSLNYSLSNQLSLELGTEIFTNGGTGGFVGLHFTPIDNIGLKAGFLTLPQSFIAGVSINCLPFMLNCDLFSVKNLGWTFSLGLGYEL